MRSLAQENRALFNIKGASISLTKMRELYKHYDVKITLWPPKGMKKSNMKKLRGAYQIIDGESHVIIDRTLPSEQRVFTMAHELKHHIEDLDLIKGGASACQITSENNYIEIGAEVFAAELIYPEVDFQEDMALMGIGTGQCTITHIEKLRQETNTTLSWSSLTKRAEFLGYAQKGSLPTSGWTKIHEQIYGEPDYKRIRRLMAAKQRTY